MTSTTITPRTQQLATPPKQACGSCFVPVEEKALTKSWICLSEDNIIGSDPKGEVLFTAVNNYYDTIKPSSFPNKNFNSVERRVCKIRSNPLSFPSYVAKVTNAQPSGMKSVNVLYHSTGIYTKLKMSSVSESCAPLFNHLEFWYLLKEHLKLDRLVNPLTLNSSAPNTKEDRDDAD